MSSICRVCGDVMSAPLLTRSGVPVVVNKTFATQSDARAVPRGDIQFAACTRCGFLSNLAFDPSIELYDDSYDNGQAGSARFRHHVTEMALRVRSLLGEAGSVVEIGCGQAEFIAEIVRGTTLTGVGFDPAYVGPNQLEDGRVVVSSTFAPPSGTRGDVVVSRHVVEHVSDPFELLELHRDLANAHGTVVIETPDASPIVNGQVFHDVFYEHCSLFTAQSFAWAAHRLGMTVRQANRVFDDWFLWTELVHGSAPPPQAATTSVPGALAAMAEAELALAASAREFLASGRHQGGVAVWGAAAKGSTFLHLCDPDAVAVLAAVDVNPTKQGRFMAGTGHAIVAPSELADLKPSAILVMNPSYGDEIVATIRALELRDVRVFGLGDTSVFDEQHSVVV